MKALELKVKLRKEKGSSKSKNMRRNGEIPCVIYGGSKNINISVNANEIKKFIYTPNVYLVNMDVENKNITVKIQDVQFHPVKEEVLHIDFIELNSDKQITMKVPLRLEGLPIGVSKGGHLIQKERKLLVKSKLESIPDTININVADLDIGKNIRIEDLKQEGYTFVSNSKTILAQCKFTRAAMSVADSEKGTEGTVEDAEKDTETE